MRRDRFHPGLFAGLPLAADIHRTGWIVAHQYDCQSGLYPAMGQSGYLGGDLLANPLAPRGTIDETTAPLGPPPPDLVSRITTPLICPGYCSSASIRRAISSARVTA